MELASRGSRLLAQILDSIIAFLPMVVAGLVGRLFGDTAGLILMIAAVILCIGYYLFADALPGGQSYGKRALDIAVLDADSYEPCSRTQSFIRNLLLSILGPIDWLFIFGARHQRIGDMAARTIVVLAPPVDDFE